MTNDIAKHRFCDSCHRRLPLSEFAKTGRYHRRACRSCTAGRSPARSLRGPENYLRNTAEDLRRKRQKEGTEWNITPEFLIEKYVDQSGRCALSGLRMTHEAHADGRFNVSIDRVDPGGPYNPENVRLVCKWCNSMKSNFSDSDFFWMLRTIVEYQDTQ